jgi:hypothetical protein
MNLFDEFFSIVREFRRHRVVYSVVGGIAMAFHAEARFTRDIDMLVAPDETDRVKEILARLGYFESTEPWTSKRTQLILHRFTKTEGGDHLTVDILSSGEEKYKEIIEDSTEEEAADGPVKVASKSHIVWMKQQRGSDQDKVDIKRLKSDKNRKDG